jgi:hypothetical protein
MHLRTPGKRLRTKPNLPFSVSANRASARVLVIAGILLTSPLTAAPPVVRTISGGLLTIDIGDDTSFQVRDRRVPDTALFRPEFCAAGTTGDTGTLVSVGGTAYAPDFASHPCGTGVTQSFTAWTPASISPVTGTGSADDPFTVRVVVVAGATGLQMTETITHVSDADHFDLNLHFQNLGAAALTFDTFVATDMWLGIQYVVPYLRYATPGGIAAVKIGAPTPACALHRYYVLLPIGSGYTGATPQEMWAQIAGGSLPNFMNSGCSYEGIATQLPTRSLAAGQSATTTTTGLSFIEGDPFAKASVPAASPAALVVTGIAVASIGVFLARNTRV